MTHKKNHKFSLIAGIFIALMLTLMIVPLIGVLARSYL